MDKGTIVFHNDKHIFDDISALVMLMIFREDRLQYKRHMREKRVEAVTSDPFFSRHVGGHDRYDNKTIMDFLKTEDIKIS